MKRGLIVYNHLDQEKNIEFINRFLSAFNNQLFSLNYVNEDALLDYLNNHQIDFIIYRARNALLLEKVNNLGIKTYNNPLTNKIANDKYLTSLFLKENAIEGIPTFINRESLCFPFIIKSKNGHGGQEVYLIHNDEELSKLSKKDVIYQPYLENDGDVRIYLLKQKIIAAVKRFNKNDYRSNYSLGGEVVLYKPSIKMQETALKIAKLLNSDFIGVDFLLTKEGYLVNEIEDPVGSRMLYRVSDIDIISLFINYIKEDLKENR